MKILLNVRVMQINYNADCIDNDNDVDGDVDCSNENCDDYDDNNAHVDHDG